MAYVSTFEIHERFGPQSRLSVEGESTSGSCNTPRNFKFTSALTVVQVFLGEELEVLAYLSTASENTPNGAQSTQLIRDPERAQPLMGVPSLWFYRDTMHWTYSS